MNCVVELTAKELKKKKQENFEITGTITKKWIDGEHGFRKHALTILEDETGTATLNLWNDQVEQVSVGDTIRLKRAYTKNTKGVWQIHTWEERIEILPNLLKKG